MTTDLGQYQFRGEIGRGAMAIVWLGWDTKLERQVAVKEPMPDLASDPAVVQELMDRFVRESRAAGRLSHPGIVAVYDADAWDGRAAIIMEYVEGETLGPIIDRGRLPVPTAVAIADQLLDALSYAHQRGVVHRDIKPDNVFITMDGRVKLADFGVAYIADAGRLTKVGTIVGTPGYMAPEQIRNGPVDERSDVFSAGVLTYEMISGRNPFGATDGLSLTEIMQRVVMFDPPVLDGSLPGLTPQLRAVVDRALAKDPVNRYQNAAEMRVALAAALDGGGYEASAPASTWATPAAAPRGAGWRGQGGDSDGESVMHGPLILLVGGVLLGAIMALFVDLWLGLVVLVAAAIAAAVWWPRDQAAEDEAPAIFAASEASEPAAAIGAEPPQPGEARLSFSLQGPRDARSGEVPLPCTIGRGDVTSLTIDDERASRVHARIAAWDGQLVLEDLASGNGTYVEGVRVSGAVYLAAGQRVRVGDTTLTVLSWSAAT
jgi:tRNA A-37 threonylcarbamoyl transferase component Bud32